MNTVDFTAIANQELTEEKLMNFNGPDDDFDDDFDDDYDNDDLDLD